MHEMIHLEKFYERADRASNPFWDPFWEAFDATDKHNFLVLHRYTQASGDRTSALMFVILHDVRKLRRQAASFGLRDLHTSSIHRDLQMFCREYEQGS